MLGEQSHPDAAGREEQRRLMVGRPDQSISDIRKVRTVIKLGRTFDSAKLWKKAGFRL
jgi:hypothetical protein